MNTRADQIRHALQTLQPMHLEVLDESHMHSRGLETHYKAVIVSEAFAGKRLLQRHQAVYAAMGGLMQQVHALALHTHTPEEWAADSSVPDSPTCRGGSKHDLARTS
ncbi:BolA family protein [Xanthomonas sp. XNM01]|uniref:BolA family protein n=1 Tax=Xanthomonas sp. XNM01 TaxID=2769289 RepID=UPI00177CF2A8|nr:BolA family protein [Xanthomonas sp. XNM01]MBD9369408.1 BolA family transcriptional regulator [Xanthomonas sp. XNM01]